MNIYSETHTPDKTRGAHGATLSHDSLRQECITFFMLLNDGKDPSHDLLHMQRVDDNQRVISAREGGDPEILIPAAYLHDIVNYPKSDPRSRFSAEESGRVATQFLRELPRYPQQKIPLVAEAIRRHSFSAALPPVTLEDAILQDADRLESVGIVALMRTFASCGVLGRQLFDLEDPFCEGREPDPSQFGLDLYYTRLLRVEERLNTETAKEMGRKRVAAMQMVVEGLRGEMVGR